VDSTDRLAIAVNLGNAREQLGLERDRCLLISPAGRESE
jgi:S-adenosylmethionine hydrolase